MWLVVGAILAAITCSQAAESVHITVLPPPKSASNDSSIIGQSGSTMRDGSRIVGGEPTTIEKHPYAVQVLRICSYFRGGTLLTNRHVLSSASAFVDKHLSRYAVRVGATRLNVGGSVHSVSKIVRHEKYKGKGINNNVAVLFLASDVPLGGGTVGVARLPVQDYDLQRYEKMNSTCGCNVTLVAVGWGRTNVSVPILAPVLMEVEMVEVSFEECKAVSKQEITTNMICASAPGAGAKGPCRDDWGSPLIYKGMVVGITTVVTCITEDTNVFTKVAKYADWINTTVQSPERGKVFRLSGEDAGAAAAAGAGLALLAPLLLLCVV